MIVTGPVFGDVARQYDRARPTYPPERGFPPNSDVLPRDRPAAQFLDVGCGTGLVPPAVRPRPARSHPPPCWGVEPDERRSTFRLQPSSHRLKKSLLVRGVDVRRCTVRPRCEGGHACICVDPSMRPRQGRRRAPTCRGDWSVSGTTATPSAPPAPRSTRGYRILSPPALAIATPSHDATARLLPAPHRGERNIRNQATSDAIYEWNEVLSARRGGRSAFPTQQRPLGFSDGAASSAGSLRWASPSTSSAALLVHYRTT